MPIAKKRAEVWGSPIAHSLSPALHRAAYLQLGLDWSYDSREVTEATLGAALDGVSADLAGLSLTMPLKEPVLELVEARSAVVDLLGVANTVARAGDGWMLDNTDPWGVLGALEAFSRPLTTAWIIGAGATARSAGYALHLTGVTKVVLVVRSPERAKETATVLGAIGLEVVVVQPDAIDSLDAPDVVVSTVPGGATFPLVGNISWLTQQAGLLDVSYSPWPSSGAAAWAGSPQPIISGLTMLIFQALRQVRIFVQGDSEQPLPDEDGVLHAMKQAVSLPTA